MCTSKFPHPSFEILGQMVMRMLRKYQISANTMHSDKDVSPSASREPFL